MHRFFVPRESISEGRVTLPEHLFHRLHNVLRLGAGDRIIVLDDSGLEYEVELKAARTRGLEGVVISKAPASAEPRTSITLYQGLLKGSGFDLVLQKCTEIGVSAFVPMMCQRTVAGEPSRSRLERWRSVIREAAEQSRRGRLPVLHPAARFHDACRSAQGIRLIPWEGETVTGISSVLGQRSSSGNSPEVGIFIGPEGGLSADEVDLARGCGIAPVSLGRRILKAETAGLVAAAITLHELGDLDYTPDQEASPASAIDIPAPPVV